MGRGRINSLFASSMTSISKSFTEIFRKYESRAYEIINYMLYFFAYFKKKLIKKLLTFCYWNSKIGFIFQDFYLMDSLSVEENIMLPMIISKQNINKMIAEAKKYAEQFQIEHLLKKNPYELSGGEKQRVAICRALINNPDLILADEPTGNLDSKSGKIVIDALNKISSEYKKTIVMVTHDPQMASYCSRLILLKDGVILEDLKNSGNQDAFYQEILGKMKEL